MPSRRSPASACARSKKMRVTTRRHARTLPSRWRRWTRSARNTRTRSGERTSSLSRIRPVAVPAPPLPTDGDAVPNPFELNGRQYPDTVITRNAQPGPAFRAPGLSIPAGLTPDGLPAGLEIDGLPGADDQLLRLGMAIEAVLGPLPPPTFRNA